MSFTYEWQYFLNVDSALITIQKKNNANLTPPFTSTIFVVKVRPPVLQ